MSTSSTFDHLLERIETGGSLTAGEIAGLAGEADILPLGMLADTLRRRLHGTQVTYVRVAACPFDKSFAEAIPPVAREVRITGAPPTLAVAKTAVESARAVAGERAVSGFSWADVVRLAESGKQSTAHIVDTLRDAGLDALAEIAIDAVPDLAGVISTLTGKGFQQLRLTIDKAAAADRGALMLRAASMQEQFACIQAINPLPMVLHTFRPTTGYDDVKGVAIARLAAPNIPCIQVDWLRYGPKLAQVALTFGADDVDSVSASDEAPEGRRRAPLEEVRRNIEAAGFSPAERDGRFSVLA
jgi:aminodeoxyfutalosine synthase